MFEGANPQDCSKETVMTEPWKRFPDMWLAMIFDQASIAQRCAN